MRKIKQSTNEAAPARAAELYLDAETTGVDPDAIGVEVSWSFGDGSADSVRIKRAHAVDAFARYGFLTPEVEYLFQPLDTDECLRRARSVAKNRTWLVVRDLARHNRDVTRVLGVYVRRDPNAGAEVGDGWEMIARVRYEDARGEFAHLPPEGCAQFADDKVAGSAVEEACRLAGFANLVRDTAVNGDVSDALVKACGQAHCISRRPGGGGVYLVLAGPRCGKLVGLLKQLSRDTREGGGSPDDRNAWRRQFCYQAQEVYAKPLTTASWAQSAEQQITGSVDRLLADLEELLAAGSMRAGTMIKRAAEADALLDLAGRCGSFLADRVPVLQERLKRVSDAFSGAAGEDLSRARALLADVPDPARTAKALAAAAEREARAAAKNGKAAEADATTDSGLSLDQLLGGRVVTAGEATAVLAALAGRMRAAPDAPAKDLPKLAADITAGANEARAIFNAMPDGPERVELLSALCWLRDEVEHFGARFPLLLGVLNGGAK